MRSFNFSNKTFLTGHKSFETAYVIESYPYGRLRTKMYVWIETNKKGTEQREVRQTINPKTNRLNAPKKSTYSNLIIMYIDHNDNNYLKSFHISYNYSSVPELKELHEQLLKNNIELTVTQKELFRYACLQLEVSHLKWSYNAYTPETLFDIKDIVKRNVSRFKENDFENLFNSFELYPPEEIKKEDQESYFTSTVYKGINSILNNTPEKQEEKKESLQLQIMTGKIKTREELQTARETPETTTEPKTEPTIEDYRKDLTENTTLSSEAVEKVLSTFSDTEPQTVTELKDMNQLNFA